ncbi:MAG: cytidylyltransferase domain-containing protein, partial [Phenylobacterium sp.]
MATAILQARMSSSRLPGKVLKPLLGQPMILRQVERLRRCRELDRIVVATSLDPSDDILAETLAEAGLETVRGPLDDVLGRFVLAADQLGLEGDIVRLTADCPLAD